MKNYLIILIASLFLFSCSSKNSNRIIVTGTISNYNGQLQLNSEKLNLKRQVSESGLYKFSANLERADYIKLKTRDSEISLFLFPGDSIHIDFDDKDWISTIQFSGTRVAEQEYLRDYYKFYISAADTFDIVKYFSHEPQNFLNTVNAYMDLFLDRLEKSNNQLEQAFVNIEKARITYIWSFDKNTYPKNHYSYTQEYANLPDNYFDYINQLNLNDTLLLRFEDYKDFIREFVDVKYYLMVKDDKLKKHNKNLETKIKFEIIEKFFNNSKICNYLYYNTILSQIGDLAVDSSVIAKFNTLCTNEEFKINATKKFNNIQPLLKGKPAPNFRLVSQDLEKVSLDDYKGKYLYIDFWATSCSPCIREIPYLNKLEKDFHGKNIDFLGICIESNKDTWKKIIKDKKPSGTQIWLDKEQGKKIMQDYKITVQPTYVLIDREGNYIDSRAPRPSENIKEILNALKGI